MKPLQLIFAIFLNLFALPGAGQWHLKLRKRALIFIIPSLLVVFAFIGVVFHFTQEQLNSIKAQRADLFALTNKLSESLWVEHEMMFKVLTFLLIVFYVASLADVIWLYQSSEK